MAHLPPVSVVVTTYNQAPYIGEAMESVFGQTLEPAEIIVVDDGSTDGTAERLVQFAGRIRYIRQENQGVAASRNTGVAAATGEYVALLDGDDLWEPEKLAVQVPVAHEHPMTGMIVTNGTVFGEGVTSGRSLFQRLHRELRPHESVFTCKCYAEFLRGNPIVSVSQVLIPLEVLKCTGLSDRGFALSSDYDLYLRIAARYEITFISQPLVRYRYLPTSASGPAHRRPLRWSMDDIRILKKQRSEGLPEYRGEIRKLLARMVFTTAEDAYDAGRSGNRGWATRYLLRLMATNPGRPWVWFFLVGLLVPHAAARTLGKPVRRALKAWHGRG